MARDLQKPSLALVGLYIGLSLMLSMIHAHEVNFGHSQHARSVRHSEVLTGEGDSPYTYRVLVPSLVAVTQQSLRHVIGQRPGLLEVGYVAWRFLFTLALVLLFDVWLRHWLDPPWAVAGTILLVALHPVSYMGYWFQPDSTPDFALWVLVAVLTTRGRFAPLYPLILIGTLNRETAVFAVVIYVALRFHKESIGTLMRRTAGLAGCWAIPFVTLRLLIGIKPWSAELANVARSNFLEFGWVAALVFFGALWLLPWTSWRLRPRPLRRLAVLLTATYIPLQIVFGRLMELRLLIPLGLAYIPLAMMAIRDSSERSQQGLRIAGGSG